MFEHICLPNISLSEAFLWICLEMFIVARVVSQPKKAGQILASYHLFNIDCAIVGCSYIAGYSDFIYMKK